MRSNQREWLVVRLHTFTVLFQLCAASLRQQLSCVGNLGGWYSVPAPHGFESRDKQALSSEREKIRGKKNHTKTSDYVLSVALPRTHRPPTAPPCAPLRAHRSHEKQVATPGFPAIEPKKAKNEVQEGNKRKAKQKNPFRTKSLPKY